MRRRPHDIVNNKPSKETYMKNKGEIYLPLISLEGDK
jgi:hypothetical protein